MSYVIRNECCMLIMEFAGVRQSITNCISKFIQSEDCMLTCPNSKRVPFNRPRSTNKISRRFDFPNGVEGCGAEGEGSGQGYFPAQWR